MTKADFLSFLAQYIAVNPLAFDDQWITVHPGGKYNWDVQQSGAKGQPVLLDDRGRIKGGMGGKFNGKTMGQAIQASKSQSRLVQEEYEQNKDREFWERVWGGISTKRLGAADPETVKMLRTGGYKGVFAERGGGETIEDLVVELENEGVLDYGSTPNDLLELILSKEPPDARTRARWKAQNKKSAWNYQRDFETMRGGKQDKPYQPQSEQQETQNYQFGGAFYDDPDRPDDSPF